MRWNGMALLYGEQGSGNPPDDCFRPTGNEILYNLIAPFLPSGVSTVWKKWITLFAQRSDPLKEGYYPVMPLHHLRINFPFCIMRPCDRI